MRVERGAEDSRTAVAAAAVRALAKEWHKVDEECVLIVRT